MHTRMRMTTSTHTLTYISTLLSDTSLTHYTWMLSHTWNIWIGIDNSTLHFVFEISFFVQFSVCVLTSSSTLLSNLSVEAINSTHYQRQGHDYFWRLLDWCGERSHDLKFCHRVNSARDLQRSGSRSKLGDGLECT